MNIETIISEYGLLAVFLGCFLEGETVALTGGVMAHRHLLVLWQVTAAAFAGAFISDTIFFILGRRYQSHRWIRKITQNPRFARAQGLLNRHPAWFTSLFRFVPGMRVMGPIALANSQIDTRQFLIRAAVSAAIWSVIYTILGHIIGRVITMIFGHIDSVLIILAIPLIIVLIVAFSKLNSIGSLKK